MATDVGIVLLVVVFIVVMALVLWVAMRFRPRHSYKTYERYEPSITPISRFKAPTRTFSKEEFEAALAD